MSEQVEQRNPATWTGMMPAEVEMIISNEGQIKSADALRRIVQAIRELPEDQVVLGIVFGVTTAPMPEVTPSGVKLDADCIALRWGLPPAVAMAAAEALGVGDEP